LTSPYKGVSFDKARLKWAAYIKYDGKVKNLGRFDNEEEAAVKYNEYASKYFGEHAFLNEIHPAVCPEAILA
jgi:AP2-like factor (euAP2 lineage)